VIVFVGYNDDPATYRKGMPAVLKAMRNHGVTHVLWLTLRAKYKQYIDINHAIYAAQQKWRPLLTVLDWNHYSTPHPSWYGQDGIHMSGAGAVAFASYLHRTLKQLGLNGPVPKTPT
jgi:lysophospholipase L1-like esterase